MCGATQRFGLFFALPPLGLQALLHATQTVGMIGRRDHVWRFAVPGALGALGSLAVGGGVEVWDIVGDLGIWGLGKCLMRRSSPTPPSERKPPCTRIRYVPRKGGYISRRQMGPKKGGKPRSICCMESSCICQA